MAVWIQYLNYQIYSNKHVPMREGRLEHDPRTRNMFQDCHGFDKMHYRFNKKEKRKEKGTKNAMGRNYWPI